MDPIRVPTRPFEDQRPGTSGLRRKVAVFRQPHYLENFVQSVFDAVPSLRGATLVLGGDGRFHNDHAVQVILRMAAANGVARVIVGASGILSTPAASALIRGQGAMGGIILSASHNEGGPAGDFGIKFNGENGGPAPERITEAIYACTTRIGSYRTLESADIDVSRTASFELAGMRVEVVDPVEAYAKLLQGLFDFDRIAALLRRPGFAMQFDAMHAVTGPYARTIFEGLLGAPRGSAINADPLPDFGGGHPDPNPVHARELVEALWRPDGPQFGAASDGDGDRNMIGGRGILVSPGDSLAILAANARLVPGTARGIQGIARSMPTSRAADRVARALGVPCYETPTGWKYFGTLLDAGRVTLCGEESYGTGSDHVREKDGIWAVLFWLNLLAVTNRSVGDIVRDHWKAYGRDFFSRHDYEGLDAGVAGSMLEDLRSRLARLPGSTHAGLQVASADDFSYTDPVDGSRSEHQGIRIGFEEGERAVMRLSGTGSEGATLRVYLERFENDPSRQERAPAQALARVAQAAGEIAGIASKLGRERPDVVTA